MLESFRQSRFTRPTSSDFSAVIRHAHRQHLLSRPAGKLSPSRNHSTPGAQTTASSFGNSLNLVARIPAASSPRLGVRGVSPVPAPRLKPRFRAWTLFVILARTHYLLWIAARLAGLVLAGAGHALWKSMLLHGRLWLARVMDRTPLHPESGNDAYPQVEEDEGTHFPLSAGS